MQRLLQKPNDDVFNDSGHIDASFSVQNDEPTSVQTVGTSTVQIHETSTAQSSENSKFQTVATPTAQNHETSQKCENASNQILQMTTSQNDKVSGIATNEIDSDNRQETSTTSKCPNAQPVQSSSKQFKNTTLPIFENLNKSEKSSKEMTTATDNLSDRATFRNQFESEKSKLTTSNETSVLTTSGDFDTIQATSSLDTSASTDMDEILHNFYDGERTCSDEEFEAEAIELLGESQQMKFSAEDYPNSVWSYSDPEFQNLLASLSSDPPSDQVLCHLSNPHPDQLDNPASDQDPKPVAPNNLLQPSPDQSVSESPSLFSDPLSDEVLCHPANPHSDQLINPTSNQDPKLVDPNNLLQTSPEQSVSESLQVDPFDLNLCTAPVPAKIDSNPEAVAKPVTNQPTVQDLMGSVEVFDHSSEAGIQDSNIVAKQHLIPPTVPVVADQHIAVASHPLSNPPSKSLSAEGPEEVLKPDEPVSNPAPANSEKPATTGPTTTRLLKSFVIPRILKDRTSILPTRSSRLPSYQQGTVNIVTKY